MKKNQLTTIKSTDLILGKSKSLMGITKKILESKSKGLVKAKTSQELTTHKDITIMGDLMWEKETQEEMDWDDAMEYAENLRLGDYDDWRLPSVEEFEEIVKLCGGVLTYRDENNSEEVIANNKSNASYQVNYKARGFESDDFWSSTTGAGYSSSAWNIYFSSGYRLYYFKSRSSYVRCVRSGQ